MQETDETFEELLQHLKEARGFDFTGYKRTSLRRRVERRMQDVGVSSYEDYQDHLAVHPHEFTLLFNTILINVTEYFRDREAWDVLRDRFLPELLAARPEGPLRFWSAGSAAGQEAYSLAILLVEALGVEAFRSRVKVYATDIDEEALAQARTATYSDRELKGVTKEQLERYFQPTNGRYAFRKDLRRSVVFGRNDLVQDAPISRLDLIVCRNTLMYFNAETQANVLKRFAFALNPAGLLFLGKAEMLLTSPPLFAPADTRRRFFRRADVPRQQLSPGGAPAPGDAEQAGLQQLRDLAWANGPAAQVVVDREGRFAASNTRAESLFGLDGQEVGRRFSDLELSYRPVELRSHIELALRERRALSVHEVDWVQPGGQRMRLEVEVVPVFDSEPRPVGVSVAFFDVSGYRALQDELEFANRQLETAYGELRSTSEELETTNEELQSTIEELETSNEELHSTNEELETMNEELQSMNDELHGGNEELRARGAQAVELNWLLERILTSLGTAVVVVDRDGRVRVWNRGAEDLWGVRQEEALEEPLVALDIGLSVEHLEPLVDEALSGRRSAAPAGDGLLLDAVDRRGRPLQVRARVLPLDGDPVAGVILVIEPVREGASGTPGRARVPESSAGAPG